MSVLSRLHQAIKALGGVGEASVGIATDLILAPFTDDESDGIIETLYDSTVKNGSQFFSSTIGPEGLGGTLIGAIPGAVRSPVASVMKPIFSGLETTYREGISEPLSTAITAGSLASAESGIPGLFTPSTWSRAYRLAQHRSPGQALALAIGTKNITDEAEIAKYAGSDAYKIISGTTDAFSRVFLDPTVIAGKAATGVRAAAITRSLHTPEEITAALRSPRVAAFNDAITAIKSEHGDTAAAVIRNRYFPDHEAGALISTVLASAPTPREQFFGLRALMGDQAALSELGDIRSTIHESIASLNRRADQLGPIKAAQPYKYEGTIVDPSQQTALFGLNDIGIPEDIAQLRSRVEVHYARDLRAQRMTAGFATIKETPRARAIPFVPAIGEVRSTITRSDFYQNNPLGRSLQTFFHMNAHPVVNISDTRSDIQISRLMQEARLPQDIMDGHRTAYMAAADDQTRMKVALAAETDAITAIATRNGLSTDELSGIMNEISSARGEAVDALRNRVFNEDGSSVLTHQDEFGEWVETNFPPAVTTDSTLLPLINMRGLASAATDIGRFRANHPSVTIPPYLVNKFTRLWKPAVLLRPAWPIRVVGDEQFRIIAKIGALSHLDNLRTGLRDYTTDFISATRERGIRNVAGRSNREIRQSFAVREFDYRGYDMEGVFGTPSDVNRHARDLASSSDSWRALVGNNEEVLLRDMREAGANFRSIEPTHTDYPSLYNWSIERLNSHPISRRLLAGESPESVIDWLQSTPEGSDILRANTVRAHNVRNWVEDLTGEVDKYTAGSDELRGLISAGTASHDDLTRLVPDIAARPIAHGEVLNQALNKGYTASLIPKIVERTFDKLGRLPTDTLSRNPFMGHMYRAEVKRELDLLGDTPMTDTIKAGIETRARNYALNETQKLLYDLAESSRFGEMLAFISPFYNAWQEVITRWSGLAIENPVFAARARLIWRAPENMGIVTDENGREVTNGQTYSDDPASPNFRGKDRLITIPLPDWVKDIPGMKGLAGKDSVKFNKKSFNLVLQGFPTAGPLVQLPLNQIVKDRPELTDNSLVNKILPYGPTYSIRDMVLPSSAKYFLSASEQDQRYSNTLLRIYLDKITDYQTGARESKPTYAEAKAEADSFTNLRGWAAFTLPAAPVFQSPYQSYIDAFHQAQARYSEDKASLSDSHGNPRTPDEYFLDTFGKEYFALTQSVSRSLDGIPPTMDSYLKRKEYSDLVQEFPEFGGLIIGADGAGEFNSAVYNAQLHTKLRDSSDNNQRELIPFEEAAVDPDRRLGWIEYRRAMDMLEATRIQRGLPNMQVAAARDLAAAKSAVTEYLSAKFPSWKDDFNQTDKGKWENKIAALTVISSKPEMAGRPDMQGIRGYLQARTAFNSALAARKKAGGASTLNASSNQDIAEAWNVVTGHLIESNLAFSAVYYRFLENDPLGL